MKRHTFVLGESLLNVGSAVDSVSIIERGVVALRRPSGATLMLLRNGGILGDIEVITQTSARTSAVAVIDTEVLRLPSDEFRRLIQRSPEFAARWVKVFACRLAGYEGRLHDLLAGDIRAQVASLLLHEFAESNNTHLTHQMIAELLGVQRSSVSRILGHLVERGIIEHGYAHLRLRDRGALERAALGYSAGSP